MYPRSTAASIVSFALAVLVASVMLKLAADNLRAALPMLVVAAGLVGLGLVLWRLYRGPRNW